jgi:Icc-related predicted phosphoesterase
VIRIAAAGDLHFGTDSAGTLAPSLERLAEQADLFLLAGDLTKWGDPQEAEVLAQEVAGVTVPKVAVLGNHDYHLGKDDAVAEAIEKAGVRVLEGESEVFEVDGTRVGVAGVKGFGGGFAGASATEFGEPEMKAFVAHTRMIAGRLEQALASLEGAYLRIALLHYSPIEATLMGERPEIYPFLGSYLLAESIDRVGADLVLHGHAHLGREAGTTPGGIPVRNVSQHVIKRAYNVYCFSPDRAHLEKVGSAGDLR